MQEKTDHGNVIDNQIVNLRYLHDITTGTLFLHDENASFSLSLILVSNMQEIVQEKQRTVGCKY